MVRPTQDGLVARKIGEVALSLFAHRRYLDRFGTPDSVATLTKHHLIGFDRDDFPARSVAQGILPISRDLFSFRSDNDIAQLAAIQAGIGIGVMQSAIAKRTPDLVAVTSAPMTLPTPHGRSALWSILPGLSKGHLGWLEF